MYRTRRCVAFACSASAHCKARSRDSKGQSAAEKVLIPARFSAAVPVITSSLLNSCEVALKTGVAR